MQFSGLERLGTNRMRTPYTAPAWTASRRSLLPASKRHEELRELMRDRACGPAPPCPNHQWGEFVRRAYGGIHLLDHGASETETRAPEPGCLMTHFGSLWSQQESNRRPFRLRSPSPHRGALAFVPAPTVFLACAITIVSACALLALDPAKAVTQYMHKAWTTNDGLPLNSVQSIAQTRDGYLWLGTQEGLVRFDGVRFTTFDKGNTPEITNSNITALYEDRQSNLWIGTRGGGLVRLRDGTFTTYTTKQGLAHNQVWSICEDGEGVLWIGTSEGLSRFHEGQLTAIALHDELPSRFVRVVHADRDGNLWAGTYGAGLVRIRNGQVTVYKTRSGLAGDVVWALCEDHLGGLWIGTDSGLQHLSNERLALYTTADGLSENVVRCIAEDDQANLWVGTTSKGLNRMRDGRFVPFTRDDGLVGDSVVSLYEDLERNLWIGTNGGLNRLRDGKFIPYTTKEGLPDDTVYTVYEDRRSRLWMGTDNGLGCFTDGRFTTYTRNDGLPDDVTRSVWQDHTGDIWIGAYGSGISRLRHGRFTTYTTAQGLASDLVFAILEDREKNLWIGTVGGLSRFRDGTFTTYTTKDGLSSDIVRSLFEDHEGTLWIGTNSGLSRMKRGRLSSDPVSDLSQQTVACMSEDSDGILWVGTLGGGLYRLTRGSATRCSTKEGLCSDAIFKILEDAQGRLWMSCNRGIFWVDRRALSELAQGHIRSVHSVAYGQNEGLTSRDCNGGFQPAGWKASDGRLWFPTMGGVVVIDPENIALNTMAPPVHIEGFTVDDRSIAPGLPVELPPGSRSLEFQYTALSLAAPEDVHFEYKLEGFDREWIDAGNRRVAYYTNLFPGRYRFVVRASNQDGVWNKTGASLSFSLNPHFYQTTVFYLVCVACTALFGRWLHQLRTQKLRARAAVLAERYRMARDLHDTLAQDLAGIVVSLEAMEEIGWESRPQAKELLDRVRRAARKSLLGIRGVVWELRTKGSQGQDFVGLLRRMIAETFSGSTMEVTVVTSGIQQPVSPLIAAELVQIAREALTNALRHSTAACANLEITVDRKLLTLAIRDAGRGFVPDDVVGRAKGFGIEGMRERAQLLGGEMIIRSQPGRGTEVVVSIPLL